MEVLQTHPGQKATNRSEPHRPYGAGLGKHDRFIGVQNYKKNSPLNYFFETGAPVLEFKVAHRQTVVEELFE